MDPVTLYTYIWQFEEQRSLEGIPEKVQITIREYFERAVEAQKRSYENLRSRHLSTRITVEHLEYYQDKLKLFEKK